MDNEEIKTEAKLQFLGEELTHEVYRGVSQTRLMQNFLERLEELEAQYSTGNTGVWFQIKNEVTYLHNEINDIKKVLGMDGSIPGRKQYKDRL